jgi:hypothetical protein
MSEIIDTIEKLKADLKNATATLSDKEARFLVDAYYIIQEDRKRSKNQVRAMGEEPHELLAWFFRQNHMLEGQLKAALDRYSDSKPIGVWAKSLYGIGPVIAAGLMAHVDIKQAPTVGHIWSFAGYNPEDRWEKGQKRPWNADLKKLCWHIGQSFMKFSNAPDCFYGPLYKERKAFEEANNEAGLNAEEALARKDRFRKTTDAYKAYAAGKFPPAHIDARARRWVVKLFLSHLQAVWWELDTGEKPPKPYILTKEGGHAHEVRPPNWPMPTANI